MRSCHAALALLVLDAAKRVGVEWLSKTKLVKLAFLVSARSGECRSNWIRYKYGPHSPALLREARRLAKQGLIEEREEFKDDEVITLYRITPAGSEEARRVAEENPRLAEEAARVAEEYARRPLKEILETVYAMEEVRRAKMGEPIWRRSIVLKGELLDKLLAILEEIEREKERVMSRPECSEN